MKEFLMLIRENPEYGNFSPEEMQEEMERHMQWVEQLMEKGQFKEGNPLEATGSTISGKNKIVSDGPFVESKECISGFYFLLAENLEEAIEIAKGCPSLESGASLEIREVINTNEA